MKKFLMLIAISVTVFFFTSEAFAAYNVRLSTNRSPQAVVNEVAEQKGFFKEEGVKVQVFAESSGSASLQAVVGGSAEMGVGLHVRVLQGLAKKLPLCVIGMVQYGLTSKIVVPVRDKTSKKMADLKGKRLAVQMGSGTYTAWRILLKYQGLKEKDFVLKNMKTRLIPATFESGSLDVAVAWEPYASIMVSKGLARVLISNTEWSRLGKIVYPGFLYANCNWVKKNREATQRFVNAWIKAIKFINSNREETVDILAKAYKGWGLTIPRAKIKAGIYVADYDKLTIDNDVLNDVNNFAQIMHEIKKIKFVPDFKKALKLEFTNKALAKN